MDDWMSVLFPADLSPEVIAENHAYLARCADAEAAEKAAYAARCAEREKNRCPRCMGDGRIAQFTHHKGGACFTCGGTGVFAGYSA